MAFDEENEPGEGRPSGIRYGIRSPTATEAGYMALDASAFSARSHIELPAFH